MKAQSTVKVSTKTFKANAQASAKTEIKKATVKQDVTEKAQSVGVVTFKRYGAKQLAQMAGELRLDSYALALWGQDGGTAHAQLAQLAESASKLSGVKLGKLDSVLAVDSAGAVFAWRVAVNGDTYGRIHWNTVVKGSLALLRKVNGDKAVQVFSSVDAFKKHERFKGKKIDKGCALALGL